MNVAEKLAADVARHGYQLLRFLGEGGAGSVFEARQASTGQTVALKLLRQGDGADPARDRRQTGRFERETQLCAQLHHPHIVRLLDRGLIEREDGQGQLFAVFEFVPGETLKDLLVRKGALGALEAGELMGQVLDALAAAHAQGIVHRDLKPQNVMVMTTGTRAHVKVLDFGIAAFIPERQKAGYRNLTITQETMCSPSYSAPEQLRGEPPTLKTDLYAWGLLFIECLTGRPAVQGMTMAEIFHKQLSTAEVPVPTGLVGHPLADVLRRALRKNPAERAGGAATLCEEFQQVNLANIVGDLRTGMHGAPDFPAAEQDGGALTQPSTSGWHGMADDRQQITVLCCTLELSSQAGEGDEDGYDALETVQRDQLNHCIDTATRYGGHLAGSLGNSLMFYYGYPQVSDTDARRCARSALELASQVRRRSPLLAQQHGYGLSARIAIHTGMVRVRQAYLPTGITPNTALQLARMAAPGAVLVSGPARRMLEQFMEFEGGGECTVEGSGETLPYSALAGEYSAESVSFLRGATGGRVLVGRADEFEALANAWDAAKAGQGSAVLVQGEAGIGKSRLCHELGVAARRHGSVTKECRCLPEYQNNALHPILEMLKHHWQLHHAGDVQDARQDGRQDGRQAGDVVARLRGALEQAGCAVESVLPILCSWLALPIPAEYPLLQFSPDRQKKMLLDALQSVLLQIGDGQGLLLLVEDLHWIDQTSLELLTQTVKALPSHAALVVMTARPGFVPPWQDGQVDLLAVGRLAEPAAEHLIASILGGKPLAPDSLRRLCERCDGIPLFVEELTRMLLDNRMLVEREGVFHLDARFDDGDIPVTLRDLLAARLSCLGAAKESAQLASAIGREFDYGLLVDIALADEGTVQDDLEQMVAAGLVYRQRRVHGDSYIFRHALLRDAAYDAMPKKVREQTHARIARQLEGAAGGGPVRDGSQLARHFAYALEFESAVKYGTLGAQLSLERGLTGDALTLAETVGGWIAKLAPEGRRPAEIAVSRILTNALMSKHGWGDGRVRESGEQALRLLEGIEDPQLSVPTLWDLTFYHHVAGNRKTVRSLTDQLFFLADRSDDQGLHVACHTIRGISTWIDGNHDVATQALAAALHGSDPASNAKRGYALGLDARVWAMAGMGCVQWFSDPDDAAVFSLARAAVGHAREINHIPSLGVALLYLAMDYQWSGDRDNCLAVSGEMLELAQKYGLPAVEAYGAIMHSWATDNLAVASQVLDGLKGMGCMLGFTCVSAMAAEIEAKAGDHAAALARVESSLALADQSGELYYKPELLIRSALFRAKTARPDPGRSREDLLRAIAMSEAVGKRRSARNARLALDAL